MKHLASRFILALSLMAGIAPAMAQAPAPVPALPDAERRTSYSLSASTCACSVNFALYGDSTDYQNWVEVWVNGVRYNYSDPANGWKLTSPSGSFASMARPITDAVLTFTAAQTGTVQIIGARRPRRTSQFSENRGVAARDLNQALTDIVAQNRETWDKTNDVTGRAILAPPGETVAVLAAAATRANQGACFDSSGNLTTCASFPSTTLIAGAGISLTGAGPKTIAANLQAGSGIAITGTNPLTISSSGAPSLYVTPKDYGALCDGSTNDATALQNMLTGSTGKTIFLPPGTCVTNSTLNVPSNTTIVGATRDGSAIKGTATPVFLATNTTNVSFSTFTIQGTNSVSNWASGTAGAIQVMQNSSAVAAGANYNITGIRFKDFNNAYWVYFGSQTSTFPVYGVNFSDNFITTTSANVPNDANPLNDNNYGFVMFGATGGNGQFIRTRVNNNKMEAGAICFPIILFSNHTQTEILGNQIDSPGRTTPAHCVNGFGTSWNTYGIAIYDLNADGNPATNWIVANNIITNPFATGIYIVGDVSPALSDCKGCLLSNNVIYGQAQQDANPRGAVVVSSTTNVSVIGNIMNEGYGGLVISGQTNGTVLAEGNNCKSSVAYVSGALRPSCLNLAGAGIAAPTGKVLVYSNNLETSGSGSATVLSNSATGNRYGILDLAYNSIVGTGLNTMDIGGSFSQSGINVRQNYFSGTLGFASITGNLTLLGNVGMSFTAATLPTATNGSSVFVSDGAPASACTGSSTGSTGFRQNGAWKCF